MDTVQFLDHIKVDWNIIIENTDTNKTVRKARIAALAARIIGSVLALCMPYALMRSMVAITTASTAAGGQIGCVAWIVTAIFAAIFAYDLIIAGNSLSLFLSHTINPQLANENIVKKAANVAKNAAQAIPAIAKQLWDGIPFVLEDTVLCKPIYKLVRHKK
ncbi:MAG: hypothetical protein JWO53_1303 [Chlamydiia bacterium]|nr:hypothetical protein [Chlamydiia bacterium]